MKMTMRQAVQVLSTVPETVVDVPGVTAELDLQVPVTRAWFAEAARDLIARAIETVEGVLRVAGVTREQVNLVEAIGGGLRIPALQAALSASLGRELARHLDSSASVATGAALSAALEVSLHPAVLVRTCADALRRLALRA
jgi:molecular chaperone DnaK (HSP70)